MGTNRIVVATFPVFVDTTTSDSVRPRIAVDLLGNIWVAQKSPYADGVNSLIMYLPDGRIAANITAPGRTEFGFGADDEPRGIAFGGSDGRTVLLSADNGGNCVTGSGTMWAIRP